MQTNPVHDFILAEPENFKNAYAVANAWSEIRQQVVSGFFDRLDKRLKTKLKRWQSEREQIFYENSWASYNLWKPAWGNQYGLGLMSVDYGKELVFGVYRDKDNFGQRPFCGELLKAVATIQSSAKKNPWWEAQIRMNHPAPDWSKPEVLWQMHTDKKFLDEVAWQLLEVAKVSESIIDRLARKKWRITK
jgi:hypothetical protein